jgi:hypothetical protein
MIPLRNYTANATFVGEDKGFGFGLWTLNQGQNGEAEAALTPQKFLLFPTATNTVEVRRALDSAIKEGETFSIIDFATQTGSTSGSAELTLNAGSSGTGILVWDGSNWAWSTVGGTGDGTSTIASEVLSRIDYTRTGSATYTLKLTGTGGSDWTTSGSLSTSGNSGLSNFWVESNNGYDVAFTTLQVVPEPSTYAILVAGGLTAIGAAVRRRRRQAASVL